MLICYIMSSKFKYETFTKLMDTMMLFCFVILSVSIPKQPKTTFSRIVVLSLSITSSFLITFYYCKILNILTKPHEINSKEELLKSDLLKLAFSDNYAQLAFTEIEILTSKCETFFSHNTNMSYFEYVGQIIKSEQPYALLLDYSLSNRILKEYRPKSFYFMHQKVTNDPVHIYSDKSKKFSSEVARKVTSFFDFGIIAKFIDKHQALNLQESNNEYLTLNFFSNIY